MYFKQVFSKIPKNEMKFIHVSREKLSFSFYNKSLTKSSSEIKLFFFKKSQHLRQEDSCQYIY